MRLVYGTNDSYDLIRDESKDADLVFHFADSADNQPAAKAIVDGLESHSPQRPGWLIHTSGTGILTYVDVQRDVFGELSEKVHDDWDKVEELTSLPDIAWHRDCDKIVLASGNAHPDRVKTAIVCPPHIYGLGRGPGNKRSINIYNMAKMALERKRGFQVASGKNIWHAVHVYDLSELYILLADAAMAGGGEATWGKEGYYLAEQEEFVWGELAGKISKVAHGKGLIPSSEIDAIPVDEIKKEFPLRYRSWGANSRGKAIRANKLLGWECNEKGVDEALEEIVMSEAKALGLA